MKYLQYTLSLIEANRDPLLTVSMDGKITGINIAAVNVTGKKRENLIGSYFADYFAQPQNAGRVYEEVFANGSVSDYPLTIKHQDGKLTEVLLNGSVYKDDEGNVVGVVAVARDTAEQKWATDLRIANKELAFQNEEKEKRAAELLVANKELAFQNEEKEKRADELVIANKELAFQNEEKGKRADELVIANKELAFQNDEKGKRADELVIADKELEFQNEEKGKRADELVIADKELAFQNIEKEKKEIASKELEAYTYSLKVASEYARSLIEASLDPLVTISAAGKILDVNEASIKVTGVSREKLIETDFSNYFTEPGKAQEGYRQVFEKGFVADYPLTIKHKNGNLTDVLYNASVYKDDKGNVLGVFAAARDVTLKKQIEDELLKTQERLNAGLKIANIALSEISYITNTVKLSPESAAMYGFPENQLEATRQQMHDTFHPAIKAELEAQIVIAMNPDSSGYMALEHPIVLPSGEVRWLKVNKQFFYANSAQPAKPVYSILASQDITEQKQSSLYARSLIEASLDPLVTISAAGKILDVNEALIKVTGVSREKLIETDFSNYFTEPEKAQEGYRQVFEKGFVADYPLTIKHKNGNLTDVIYNASVYKDDKGNVLGVFAAARDITEQKQSSLYARSLIEASLDPLVTISADGKIMDMNEAMIDAVEKSRSSLVNTDFENYFTDAKKARDIYQEVFKKGYVIDYPLTLKDGKLVDVLFNGSVYKDGTGKVLGAVVVARDISEQKKFEKELIEAKVFAELATSIAEEEKFKAEAAAHIAEDAVKSKQQFLSNMSHEIRTPMNAIIGFTKVLLKTELSAKQREYLVAIKMSGDALIVLINDILDLAKVEAGKMMFEQIPFKMASSIEAMLHLFESKIEEKNISLRREYDQAIPKVLLGDPVRLHQVISNLLSNAVKFTAKGKITVKAMLLKEDDENVTVQFVIADTGIGIVADKLTRVFDNFQQASSGTSRLYGGTGLGLSIVKQLVEGQGGSIAVKSSIGEGSEFSFTMSFQKTNEQVAEDSGFAQLDEGIKNIKVLVVEDIALNQLLMKTLLDDFGFERDIASNGKIAIEMMAEKNYDIVLMDLQMPEMNGFDATEYIRNTLKSTIPILALTADVTTVDVAKCKAVGMNDYIAKPVDERILYSKIINLVKSPLPDGLKDALVIPGDSTLIKCIDLEYLLHRTKSDPVLMMEMISLYLEQTPPLVDAMKKSFDKKDWTGLQAAVHKIIPSFSIMGISNDFELMAKKIQEYARQRQHDEGMPDLLLKLENICIQACTELTIEFNTLKNAVK